MPSTRRVCKSARRDDGLFGGFAAGRLREDGEEQAEAEIKGQEDRSKQRVERSEEDGSERPNDDGGQRRRNDADVEIFQRFHITDDAGKQIACAEVHQAGGGEGFEFFVEPDAQFGEQAEGDIVRDEAFEVAEDGAGDAEEARADGGDAEVCDGGGDGGGGDEPSGGAHERDARADGDGTDEERRGRRDASCR